MPILEKSAEQIRIEGLIRDNPAGTRKGDDARARLSDIERNRSRESQRQEGQGQFIQVEKTRPGLKARAQAARRRN